jgi:hypothetical protein
VNGHVYGFDFLGQPDAEGHFPYKLIGIRQASTFTGFCSRHDTEMFRALESQPFTATKEQLFLLAYRALAKEVYAKRLAIRHMPLLRKGDIGKEPLEQVSLQKYLFLHEQVLNLSLRDLDTISKEYQAAFLSRDFERFSAYLVFTDRIPDFAVSGGFHPEFDFQGAAIQNLSSPGCLDFMTYTILPFQPHGVVAFVWDSKRAQSCCRLAASLDALTNDEVPDAIVRLTYEHFENSFASPGWWESLREDQQRNLLDRMARSASSQFVRRADCLVDDQLRTAVWKVTASEWL